MFYISYKPQIKNVLINNDINNDSMEYYDIPNLANFNNELFCPIRDKFVKKQGMYKLLKDIHKRQFIDNCYDPNHKFWIFDINDCVQGLFASLNCWSYYFTQALVLNRTFLFYGDWHRYAPKSHCPINSGYHCFFEPISNCDATKLINHYKNKKNGSYYFEFTPKSARNATIPSMGGLPWNVLNDSYQYRFKENVWYVHGWGFHKSSTRHYRIIQKKYGLNDPNEYEPLLWSIFLRLKQNLAIAVDQIVNKSLNKIISKKEDNLILSMPIRWGDKCINSPQSQMDSRLHPEMYCWTVDQYMSLIKILLKLIKSDNDSNDFYIIITSETAEVVKNVTENYKQDLDLKDIKYIKNLDDIMQGISVYYNKKYSSNSDPLINWLSLLSTIRLHFASNYFIFTKMSNWIYKIYKMIEFLECEPIKTYEYTQSDSKVSNENKSMECIEIIMPWGRTNTSPPLTAKLSNNLLKIYNDLNDTKQFDRFNITILLKNTCDQPGNLAFA